jgi:ribosomal protein S18 acetylase RimI-like enzyme
MDLMLQLSAGLTDSIRRSIAELEARTVAADGGRLKLEWGTLNSRTGEQVDDLLWWDGDTLLGFLGLYAFGGAEVELAGMVDPAARRRGIATTMLTAAGPLLTERGRDHALLVCPRATDTGRLFAESLDAQLDHSEHALVQAKAPAGLSEDPATTVRLPTAGDETVVAKLLEQGFGHPAPALTSSFAQDGTQHWVVERDRRAVGYIRMTLDGSRGSVYGFVIEEVLRGQGIGRDVLHRAGAELRRQGAQQIGLEVAVNNDRALGLYTSLGFERVATEDYFRWSW